MQNIPEERNKSKVCACIILLKFNIVWIHSSALNLPSSFDFCAILEQWKNTGKSWICEFLGGNYFFIEIFNTKELGILIKYKTQRSTCDEQDGYFY